MFSDVDLSAPRLMLFLRTGAPEQITHVLDFWFDESIVGVVPWDLSDDGNYAIHIDLGPLGEPREQAYIPVNWKRVGKPSVSEAVGLFLETPF